MCVYHIPFTDGRPDFPPLSLYITPGAGGRGPESDILTKAFLRKYIFYAKSRVQPKVCTYPSLDVILCMLLWGGRPSICTYILFLCAHYFAGAVADTRTRLDATSLRAWRVMPTLETETG